MKTTPSSEVPQTKVCGECNTERPLRFFRKDESSPDGRGPVCNPCNAHAALRNLPRMPPRTPCADMIDAFTRGKPLGVVS